MIVVNGAGNSDLPRLTGNSHKRGMARYGLGGGNAKRLP